jgi:hypothetical protein
VDANHTVIAKMFEEKVKSFMKKRRETTNKEKNNYVLWVNF